MSDHAFVTLSTNDKYAIGALVLANSLKNVQTTKSLVVLITPDVSDGMKIELSKVYQKVVCVDVFNSNDFVHLKLLNRPELGVTFTKLHCWLLTSYKKCVFLDADMLAIQNADELFDLPELSAACDIGWPDCFNSGMFVFTPSHITYAKLLKHAETTGSFDGGDQGLLNTYFTNWNRISFVYNMVSSVTYTYLPAFKQFEKDVKFVHFLGATKPWNQSYSSGSVTPKPNQEHITNYLNSWWNIFTTQVQTPGSTVPVLSSLAASMDSTSCEQLKTEPALDLSKESYCEHPTTLNINNNPMELLVSSNESPSTTPLVAIQDHLTTSYPLVSEHCDTVSKVTEQMSELEVSNASRKSSDAIAQRRWEEGIPDYLGEDSFDKIIKLIDSKLEK